MLKKICAWCQKVLEVTSHLPTSDDSNRISHGICPDCLRKVFADDEGDSLSSFLEQFTTPIFVINGLEGRIIAANSKALSVANKSEYEVVNKLAGHVLECTHSYQPEGCGATVHCKSCTMRRTVTETINTGKSFYKVPAHPDLHHLTEEDHIEFLISTEKVGDSVLLRIDSIKTSDDSVIITSINFNEDTTIHQLTGDFNPEIITQKISDYFKQTKPTKFVLWNLSQQNFLKVDSTSLRQLIQTNQRFSKLRPNGKTALVFGTNHGFGIGRMLEAYSEIEQFHFTIKTFHTTKEALEWFNQEVE